MKNKDIKINTLGLILIGFLSLSSSLFAQDVTNSKENIAEAEGELEAVEVTAMRFADSLYDTPVNAVNISEQQIDESGLTSVSQLLERYTDTYLRDLGGGAFLSQPSMRGFGKNSESRVLVLMDGHRLNTPDMGGINWAQIQIEDIENIEVLYGPQSATYGSFAEAGVIKISTKKWGKNGAKIGGTFGEYGEYSFYGNATYSTDEYYISAGAQYLHNSGFFAHNLNWNKSAYLNGGVKLDSKNELGFNVNFGNMYVDWPGYIYAATIEDLKNQYPDNLIYSQEDKVDYLTASLSWDNKSGIGEGTAHLGLNIRDRASFNDYSSYGYTYTSSSTLYTLSFDPKYRVYMGTDDESYLEGGVDFYYDHLDISRSPYSTLWASNPLLDSDIDRFTIAPWIAGKAQINDTFSLNASARYEAAINDVSSNYDALNDDELVNGIAAQVGVNAKINDTWNVYARFDQIFHYASVDERYSLWGSGAKYTNPDLDPEHGQNYEIGTNFEMNGFSFRGSLFYMHLNDEIAFGKYPNDINRNVGDTDRLGAQIRLGYEYNKIAGVWTSWQFVDAKYDNGDYAKEKVACVPEITSRSGLWVRPFKYVVAEVNYTWASKQYQEGYLDTYGSRVKIPDSYSLDVSVNIYPCEYTKIFFGIMNLTNHLNCTYATYNSWYVLPGRTLRCGMEIKF